jgi:hypothetical protein
MHSLRPHTVAPASMAASAVLTAALVGCGGSPAATTHGSPSATPTPAATVVTEADTGRTVRLGSGQRLVVRLGSTYWQLQPPSDAAVLALLAGPVTSAPPPGTSGCVPGQGCGTVTATYVARSDGTSRVDATRVSCGEALRCTPAQGTFVLHVVVTG